MDRCFADAEKVGQSSIKLRLRKRSEVGPFLSRAEVHDLWRSNDRFSDAFSHALAAVPMEAYFWETPALTADSLDAPFECVLTPSPALARQVADSGAFAAQLAAQPASEVISFGNLSGDADLLVPQSIGANADYAHLASFLRTAPASQTCAMWSLVAGAADHRLAHGQPGWISTSGLGVAWLHIRIDSRPKYYSYTPYKRTNHG